MKFLSIRRNHLRASVNLLRFSLHVNHKPAFFQSTWKTKSITPVFSKASDFADKTAMVDIHGKHSFSDLLRYSYSVAKSIKNLTGVSDDLKEARVSVLCQHDVSYVAAQWAVSMLGGIFVPLAHTHPPSQLEYFIKDSDSSLVIATEELSDIVRPVTESYNIPMLTLEKKLLFSNASKSIESALNVDYGSRAALIVYTSGTTGPPKGVVLTHSNLQYGRNDCSLGLDGER